MNWLLSLIKSNKIVFNFIKTNPSLNYIGNTILVSNYLAKKSWTKLMLTYLNNKFRHDFFKINKDVVIKLKGFDIIMPNHMKPIF